MTNEEIVKALRCCAKGLGHDDACENCKVGEIQDRREYIEFAAANVIERLTAERDAALADLADARSCKTCKYACDTRDCSSCKSKTCKCRECHLDKNAWEWRGLPEAPEELKAPFTEDTMINLAAQALGVEPSRNAVVSAIQKKRGKATTQEAHLAEIDKKLGKMQEHQDEQYLAILRLTIMSEEMPNF